ncbi:gas vesicle protein [Planomicrobium stackebrandtii]|uniref:Gas vesicle protein n=1 Tax=Planomicrobium stackebrandtii TaxID=253160 RepID=A0ABU0GRF7_9BACL|nr:YkuS family protein [Planomicrobium stackebrandtii]MDQ0427935.1 gas vesicle protein [Planomicrobium stackebrandtii]
MVKIAVEHPFTSVREALEKKGYQTDMLEDKSDSTDYDVIVVRDQEDLADYHMSVSLVEAKGRTLYEIVEEVEERLVRGGKIQAPQPTEAERKDNSGGGGGGFLAGAATGAVIGAAAGLLFAPKSGKELQEMVKEKAASSKDQDGESSGGAMDQVKEKANQLKDKTSGITEKAKGKADELKAKRAEKQEEKQEEKELKNQKKVIEKEIKEQEKAEKEHEKAEKAVEKEIKKADKEADKEKGGIEVVELGDASVQKDSTGSVTVKAEDKNKK